MNDTHKQLVESGTIILRRLADAHRRGDEEDFMRIVNTLDLLTARALVGGLAKATFKEQDDG